MGEDNDPGQEFEWLEALLRQMEKDGEIGILIGHIPPGNLDCLHDVGARMRALHDRFQHIIRLNLFGHTHFEEFEVHRAVEDNKPIGTSHITSSFTTHQDHNPSIRIFTLDLKTKLPIKVETHTLDIVKANEDDEYAKFFFNHDIAGQYQVKDVSPTSMLLISSKLLVDEKLATAYMVNRLAGGKGTDEYIKNG